MKFARILFLLPALLLGCSEQPQPKPVVSSALITQEQAVALVWELPETKAWAKYIEQKTEGKVRAALIVEPETPETIGKINTGPLVSMKTSQPTFIVGNPF
jgi:hypothetical protein